MDTKSHLGILNGHFFLLGRMSKAKYSLVTQSPQQANAGIMDLIRRSQWEWFCYVRNCML